MYKILVMTHGRFCEGIVETLHIFTPSTEHVQAIPFYVDGVDGENLLQAYTDNIQQEDTVVVFTDILWGSVNQKALAMLSTYENTHIITGVNLAILLELSACNPQDICEAFIEEKVQSCKDSLVYMKTYTIAFNDNDE